MIVKNEIKYFAAWARMQLLNAVKQRAYEYGITQSGLYNCKTGLK